MEIIHSEDKSQETLLCVNLPTCNSNRLLVLIFIALVEVIEVAYIGGFYTHQTSQTLHVFITEDEQDNTNVNSLSEFWISWKTKINIKKHKRNTVKNIICVFLNGNYF